MKLTKKICLAITALALVVTPFLANCNQIHTVAAAKSSKKTAKGKITLIYDAHLYNKYGHKIKNKNKYLPYAEDDANGYKHIPGFNADVMQYYGTKIINGQKFYNIGDGCYISMADIKEVNGKNSKKGKLVLLQKSAVYTKAGNKSGYTLPKRAIVKYQGKVKQVKSRPKYYYSKYFKSDNDEHFFYLPLTKIKGKNYYAIGKNRYVKAYNVASLDGYPLTYNGVTTATVLKKTATQTIKNKTTKHVLKKGQKIKVDLAVEPWAEDFEGYIFRLHDHPDEYIDESYINLRNYLPTSYYLAQVCSYVKSKKPANIKLYDVTGNPVGVSFNAAELSIFNVDGLFYIWNATTNKAELYYHLLSSSFNKKDLLNNDGTQLSSPKSDSQNAGNTLTTAEKIISVNSFVKASDVKFYDGIKLSPLNKPAETEQKQKIATDSDKAQLQKAFDSGQQIGNGSGRHVGLLLSYDYALVNAAVVLRSTKATLAQVDQANWLLETTKTQIDTLYFEDFS